MAAVKRRFALAVLLAVLVVATAAAGLESGADGPDDRSASAEPGVGFGSDTGVGSGNESGVGLSSSDRSVDPVVPPFLIEHLISLVMILAVSVPLVYAAVVVWQDGLRGLVDELAAVTKRFVVLGLVFVSLFAVLYLLSQILGSGGGGALGSDGTSGSIVGGVGGGSSVTLTDLSIPTLVVATLALAVALAVLSGRDTPSRSAVTLLSRGRTEPRRSVGESGTNTRHRATSFEDAEPTNGVYSAWLALALALDGTDRAQTPREVATRAIDSGLDEEAVGELTTLFREVRYDGAPATVERERRASDVARQLRSSEDVRSDVQNYNFTFLGFSI